MINPLKHFIIDKHSKNRNIDDTHKDTEGYDGLCRGCGVDIAYGTVCTKCHDKYRAERLSARYK